MADSVSRARPSAIERTPATSSPAAARAAGRFAIRPARSSACRSCGWHQPPWTTFARTERTRSGSSVRAAKSAAARTGRLLGTPETWMVAGRRAVEAGRTRPAGVTERGERTRTSSGSGGASRMPRSARAAPPVSAAVAPESGSAEGWAAYRTADSAR
ncbi:hypothetical protein ACH4U5_33030 [Streptomyces sp. NPDC020858]|uniref:hypothetical protein n=1 Tax=Streptomyces sp. NPDC020858 TaxID=3365097 RepID=UPI00378E2642